MKQMIQIFTELISAYPFNHQNQCPILFKIKKALKKNIILLFLLFFNLSIHSQSYKKEVLRIPDLFNLFNNEDVGSLNAILQYFDELILTKSNIKTIDLAYHVYLENLKEIQSIEDFIQEMNIPSKQLDSLIILCENSKTFSKIWDFEFSKKPGISDTVYTTLNLDMEYTYGKFLKKLSKGNKLIKEYIEGINLTGYISPSLVSGITNIHEEFNFTDKRIRLFLAIHLITVNYQVKFVKEYSLDT